MLKITGSTRSAANPKGTKNKSGGNSIVDDSMVGGGEATNQANFTKEKNLAKTTKSKILIKSKNHNFLPNSRNKKVEMDFFIPIARLTFTQLRQAFVEASILYHFNPECHIRIESDVSGYAIGRILS